MTISGVEVTPYNTAWPADFEREARRVADLVGDSRVWLEHIGSTSVSGLAAKPIIDMLMAVTSVEDLDQRSARLVEGGYLARGEFGLKGRCHFTLDAPVRTHQLHCVAVGNQAPLQRHLVFRDDLRAHPAVALACGRLESDLAQRYPNDVEAYMDGKDGLIQCVESSALAWHAAGAA